MLFLLLGTVSASSLHAQRHHRAVALEQAAQQQAQAKKTAQGTKPLAKATTDHQTAAAPATTQAQTGQTNQGIAPPSQQSQLEQNNEYSNPHIQYDRSLSCPASAVFHKTQYGYSPPPSWQIGDTTGDPLYSRTIQNDYIYFNAGQSGGGPGQSSTQTSWLAGMTAYQGKDNGTTQFDFPIEMYGTSGRTYSCTIHVSFVDDAATQQ